MYRYNRILLPLLVAAATGRGCDGSASGAHGSPSACLERATELFRARQFQASYDQVNACDVKGLREELLLGTLKEYKLGARAMRTSMQHFERALQLDPGPSSRSPLSRPAPCCAHS